MCVFQYFVMQKRQYLKRGQSEKLTNECMICQLTKIVTPSLVNLPLRILTNKYYQKPEKIKQSETIKELIAPGPSSRLQILFREALQQTKRLQMLQNYHNFKAIVTLIKPIILQRISKDIYDPLHFSGKAYRTVMHRHLSKKLLAIGKGKRKYQAKNGSGTSTESDPRVSPEKAKKKARERPSPCKQSENVTIRRLTRNLSNMVRKFEDNFYLHPSLVFQLMDSVPGHVLDLTKLEKQQLFKRELEGNISVIKEKQQIERLHTIDVPSFPVENTYGLKVRGKVGESRNRLALKESKSFNKKLSSKKLGLSSLKENCSPNQRIQTDYDYEPIGREKKKSISSKKPEKYRGLEGGSKAKGRVKKGSTSKSRLSKQV